MHFLKNLDDATLLKRIEELVTKERQTTVEILHHLREIERRKLFAARGFRSLFEYCIEHLGYSEAAAHRRITSMRMICELPEIEEKIREGKLSLSVVTQAQSFFRQEANADNELSAAEKLEVLSALEGHSTREAERELIRRSRRGVPISAERVRVIGENYRELKVTLPESAWEDLEKLRGLLAHSHPHLSWGELIALLARLGIQKLDPVHEPARTKPRSLPTPEVSGRRIPAALRREVFRRDGGRCTYRDTETGKVCGSQHALQIDHIQPFGMGGETSLENLRLRCRNHNLRSAIEAYGIEKIEEAATHPSL